VSAYTDDTKVDNDKLDRFTRMFLSRDILYRRIVIRNLIHGSKQRIDENDFDIEFVSGPSHLNDD